MWYNSIWPEDRAAICTTEVLFANWTSFLYSSVMIMTHSRLLHHKWFWILANFCHQFQCVSFQFYMQWPLNINTNSLKTQGSVCKTFYFVQMFISLVLVYKSIFWKFHGGGRNKTSVHISELFMYWMGHVDVFKWLFQSQSWVRVHIADDLSNPFQVFADLFWE
jgi:hypothetical protein